MVRGLRSGGGDRALLRPVTPALAAGVIALMALVFVAAYLISASAGEPASAPHQRLRTMTYPTPTIALPAAESEALPAIAPSARPPASTATTPAPPAGSPERPASAP